MHPYCAVKLNIIKLGCVQGEGKEMGVVRDICCAQSSSPCSWGDLKREWGGWGRSPPALLRAAVLGERHLPVHGPGQRALGSWKRHLWSCYSFSLSDQPSFALSFATPFSAKSIHQAAVGLFRCVTPGRCIQQALQLQFVRRFIFPPFFCRAALIQIPHRGNREFCISKSV